MNAFFSGTDMAELHDNAPLYNYYLSLIVNNAGTYVARIAYVATIERSIRLKNPNDNQEEISLEEEVLVLVDLDIIKEPRRGDVDSFFSSRYEVIKEENEKAKQKSWNNYANFSKSLYGGNFYSNRYNEEKNTVTKTDLWEDFEEEFKEKVQEKQKKVEKIKRKLPRYAENGMILFLEEKEFEDSIFSWLETGLDVYPDMQLSTYTTYKDLLRYYSEYFSGSLRKLEYFIECLTRVLPLHFDNVHPNLVRHKGTKLMEKYEDIYDICLELYPIFDSYPEYIENIKTIKNDIGE